MLVHLLLLGACALASVAFAAPAPPYLPGTVVMIGEFSLPDYNITGSQRGYYQYADGASLLYGRIDEIFADDHESPVPGVPRFDSAFIGPGYSYYSWLGTDAGLACVSDTSIFKGVPPQTWFLLFCSFNGSISYNGQLTNIWACGSSAGFTGMTEIWYTSDLYGTFLRTDYYLNAAPSLPILTIEWISVAAYSSLSPALFSPPSAWNCTAPERPLPFTPARASVVSPLRLATKHLGSL